MVRPPDSKGEVKQQNCFRFLNPQTEVNLVDFSFLRPLKPTIVFNTYWRFAAERQKIFFRRVKNMPQPWTTDRVFLKHKFTNAYRASDRVSQYLIRNVIYQGDQTDREILFRTILFKFFNRIETWELLVKHFGNLNSSDFDVKKYDSVLTKSIEQGEKLYSAAYIMPSGGPNSGFTRKHRMHLSLVERMLNDDLPSRLKGAKTMASAFMMLRSYPSIGDFLAYQYLTDLNYSSLIDFSEMEFVVAGPGAKDGIRKCFSDIGGLTESETIKFITERQTECFNALGINFPSLWGRPLQLIDCQNLFCEVDKYARVVHPEIAGISGRLRIKQILRPTTQFYEPWYPPKWKINAKVKKGAPDV
jgi:hypothetical protein